MTPSKIIKSLLRVPAAFIILLLLALNTSAQDLNVMDEANEGSEFPRVMSYEGYITDSEGMPLPDGQYNFKFALYTAPTGGSPIWSEEHQTVNVERGYIQLMLGKGTSPNPLNIPFDRQYYLGIQFGNETEMTPRLELTTSGYSFRASVADDVADGSITTDKLAAGAVTDEKIQSVSWNKITGSPQVSGNSEVNAADGAWLTTGNENTNPADEFIGTKDDRALMFRTNDKVQLGIQTNGYIIVTENIVMDDDNWIGVYHETLPEDPDATGHEQIFFDDDDSDIEIMGGDVGIGRGAESPEAKLHVKGHGEIERKHIVLFENSENEDGFAMTTTQDVGLGTETPEAQLHIMGTGETAKKHVALFENTITDDNIGMAITETEDVGIGTEEPEAKLHVKSDGRFGGTGEGDEGNHIAIFENPEKEGDGIAIKLGQASPTILAPRNYNNFVTFYSHHNEIVGRIEGQTYSEWTSSWEYIWQTIMFTWDVILTIGEGFATAGQQDWGEFAILIGDFIGQIAQHVEWVVYNGMNTGTYFSSGAGDYAECLERMYEDEEMTSGDVVGVYGGKITKSTKDAQQIMVISTAPIILGNRPPESEEHLYEKVAFLGQVMVKVHGPVNEGDYIILSGLEDGTGIAVSPELMTAEEFTKVVGKAWQSAGGIGLNVVNVLVGMHAGDLAKFVNRQMHELRSTQKEMNVLKSEFTQMQDVIRQVMIDQQLKEKGAIKTTQR